MPTVAAFVVGVIAGCAIDATLASWRRRNRRADISRASRGRK